MKTKKLFFISFYSLGLCILILFFSQCDNNGGIKVLYEKQVTTSDGPDNCPSWSPDGKMIAFHSEQNGNIDIWKVSVYEGNLYQLTHTDQDENWPKWSPDGKKIAFVRYIYPVEQHTSIERTGGNIFIINADGTNEYQVTNDSTTKYMPTWHPDGKTIIYNESRGSEMTFETDVKSINIETKNKQTLIEGYREASQKGLMVYDISLNLKGDSMIFSGVPPDNPTERWLYTMDLKEKNPKAIITDMYKPWFPNWKPYDNLIAFQSGKSELSTIWIIQSDGKNRKKLISSGSGDRFPCWSPNGKEIAFTRGTQNDANIWIAVLDTAQ